jgi:hypothetical protein
MRLFIKGSLKGRSPFKTYTSPSPFKERGIEGVRLINNLRITMGIGHPRH